MAKGAAEGKTVELVLAEIANDEKATRDARAVAAHALAYMGQYSPLIGMLDDERFRPNWESIVAHLREAASSDPEHAARIHDALKGAYPPGAEFLYRQLWGYTKEQLNNEGIALLDGLDSSILAVRVMSIQTLGNVLGRRLFSYNPTGTSSQRQQWIQSYRPRAQSGTLWKEVDETGGAEPEGPADRIRRAVEGAQ
jgi:hypothetical protein